MATQDKPSAGIEVRPWRYQESNCADVSSLPPAVRAEGILKASPWWKEYGIFEVKDVGSDGIFVYTTAQPGDTLAATDICNAVRELPNVVLIQVYDGQGDEIESERCGNVT